jgi:hypothetical protein
VAPRRTGTHRWRRSVALLAAALGCALALGLTGESRSAAPRPPYTVVQMNLCLSGMAGCYGVDTYPAVVREAVSRIRAVRPDVVTVNEACRRDVSRIGRRTGYDVSFVRVLYRGARLPCVRPGGRGLFGDAVLTRAAATRVASRPFAAQAGFEERRWTCVRARLELCTAHLATRHSSRAAAANDAQCAELAALLTRRAASRAVAFGGDVNRRVACAPAGFWSRTDGSADQSPGVQHVYGSDELRSPAGEVLPARHTDHDVLVVRARLARP